MAIVVDRHHYDNHSTYTVNLQGTKIDVTVTAAASIVERWLYTTLGLRRNHLHVKQLVAGIDVQCAPGGDDPSVDTLQICIGSRCLIFQLAHADDVPLIFRNFLLDRHITPVWLWNIPDRQKLESSKHGLKLYWDPKDFFMRIRYLAQTKCERNILSASMEEVVQIFFGYKLDQRKEISMSDWRQKCLSEDQVAYACVYPYCAFLLGKKFKIWDFFG